MITPGASSGHVPAARTRLPRTVRTRGAGRPAPGLTRIVRTGQRVPASLVPYRTGRTSSGYHPRRGLRELVITRQLSRNLRTYLERLLGPVN